MRLGAIFQNALAAGPGAAIRGETSRLNLDSLQRNAEREQAALADMRLQRDESARLRGVIDKTATTEQIGQLPMFDVTGQKSFVPIDVPEAAPTAGLSTAPKYTPMGPAVGVQREIAAKIKVAAAAAGLDPDIALRIAAMESSMGANQANPSSPARGVFQFMPETWMAMGGGEGEILNADANIDRGIRLTMENHKALTRALGRQPTGAELYLAHQQGLGAAKALLLNPNLSAVAAMQKTGLTAAQATRHLTQNRIDPNLTAAQVNALFYNKYNTAGAGVRQFLAGPPEDKRAPAPAMGDVQAALGPGGLSGFRPTAAQADWDARWGAGYNPDGTPKMPVATNGRQGPTFRRPNVKPRPKDEPKAAQAKPVQSAGVQPPAAVPTAESSLVAEVAAQPAGTVDATKWNQILLDTPGKPGRELAAFMDKRAELVRLAENFREARLSGKYLETVAAIKELDGTATYLHGMQALQNFADGDPRYLQAVLSESMQRQVEIQPRSDGKFDLYSYEGGKRVLDETGLTPARLEAMARTRFDAEYNARMAKISDENRASTIKMGEKQFEADLELRKVGAETEGRVLEALAKGRTDQALELLKQEGGAYTSATADPNGNILVRKGQDFYRIAPTETDGPNKTKIATLTTQKLDVGGGNKFNWGTSYREGG